MNLLAGDSPDLANNETPAIGDLDPDVAMERSCLDLYDYSNVSLSNTTINGLDSLWKPEIDSIKRYDQISGIVYLFKGFNHSWLGADRPYEVFVRYGVLETHSFLVDGWKVVFVDC